MRSTLTVSKLLLIFQGHRMMPLLVLLATIGIIQVLKGQENPDEPDPGDPTETDPPSSQLSSITGARFLREVPEAVYQCEGRDAVFSWVFDVDGTGPPPTIGWVRRVNGMDKYIMKRLPAELYTYEEFAGKARYVYNAGLRLKNVSAGDAGMYLVEVVLVGSSGRQFSLQGSTTLEMYSKAACPAYSKYPNFSLTASGVPIQTHELVGIQEDLVLSHPIPDSKPAASAELYWRNRLWERNVFASCKSAPCSGNFNLKSILLAKNDTNVVFIGIIFQYREAQPYRLEDWILIQEDVKHKATERGRRLLIDSWVIVTALLLSSLCRIGEALQP